MKLRLPFTAKATSKTMKPKSGRMSALIPAVAVSLFGLGTHANAGNTWDGGAVGDQSWNNANNWNDNTFPAYGNTADIIIAGTANIGGQFLFSNRTIRSLTFDATNDGNTIIRTSAANNDTSNGRDLAFSSNSGNATLTVDADATGNKTIARQPSSSASDLSSIILTSSLDVVHNGAGNLTLGSGNNVSGSFGTRITGAGDINKSGTGTLIIGGGGNTYTGATNVNNGELVVSGAGSINSSSGVTVGSGGTLRFNSSTALTTGLTLNSGSTIAGTNLSGVDLTIGSGVTLSPGNSPGAMTTGNLTWSDGGNYNWQLLNADGAAGTGYDTTAVTGTIALGGLTAGGFAINLWTLASVGPDMNGDALNFSDSSNYTWTLASATAGVTGFDAANFSIITAATNGTAGFDNAFTGSFNVSSDGTSVFLNYAAIPEPSTALLGCLGVLALLRRRRIS